MNKFIQLIAALLFYISIITINVLGSNINWRAYGFSKRFRKEFEGQEQLSKQTKSNVIQLDPRQEEKDKIVARLQNRASKRGSSSSSK